MRSFFVALAAVALAAPASGASSAAWRAQQQAAAEKSERILRQAEKARGLLAQYVLMRAAWAADEGKAFRLIFGQYLSWHESYLGLHDEAVQSFSIQQLPDQADAPSPLDDAHAAQPALEAIPKLAQGRQAVFFNEAHNAAITRTLTVALLERLRKDGFTHFAAETLYETDTELAKRGYPTEASGFYTQEPVYAEMVRTALKLGYVVVPYEAMSDASGDAREREQAKNLVERVFKRDPKARLVVNAGYAHIVETGKYLGGASMAQHFRKITGIDPLTIEQTMLIPHPMIEQDHPYYRTALAKLDPKTPQVFVDKAGAPWSLRAGAYDVSVLLPPYTRDDGRQSWLDIDGLRVPYAVDGEICRGTIPCLLEARYIGEGDDAIPADRIVIGMRDARLGNTEQKFRTMQGVRTTLYLRPGRYRLRASGADNQVVTTQNINVAAGDKSVPDRKEKETR